MASLRGKMKEDMTLAGFSDHTKRSYLSGVTQLYRHYKKSPAKLSEREIKDYLLYLLESKKIVRRTYNTRIHALRYFYCRTLGRTSFKEFLLPVKVSKTQPDVLSPNEVLCLLNAVKYNIRNYAMLTIIYSAGLRVSEAMNLRVKDIDRERMLLHIRKGKGYKDRYVILSPKVLKILTEYWHACKFDDYLFPSKMKRGKPLTANSAQRIYYAAKIKANVTKGCGIHDLRTAFATHLLEYGKDVFTIKELLGHSSIKSTLVYLKLVPNRHKDLCSPFDKLEL